jgi:hypothetical protein
VLYFIGYRKHSFAVASEHSHIQNNDDKNIWLWDRGTSRQHLNSLAFRIACPNDYPTAAKLHSSRARSKGSTAPRKNATQETERSKPKMPCFSLSRPCPSCLHALFSQHSSRSPTILRRCRTTPIAATLAQSTRPLVGYSRYPHCVQICKRHGWIDTSSNFDSGIPSN